MELFTNAIQRVFLGSTEIVKAYLGYDLVYQKASTPAGITGDVSEYVQDGLVMHLDGIDKGKTSGRWTSLVGSTYYTLNSYSTIEKDSILMNGAGVITGTSSVAVNYLAGTIEVVYERISGAILIYAGTNGLGLCFGAGGYTFGIGTGSGSSILNQWNCPSIPAKATASVNSNRLVVNGADIGTEKVNNAWGSAVTTCPIGGRTSGTNRYYANIRIHSIRKYNRLLTEAEMLRNQKVDNVRFNLGLNI